MKLLIIVQHCLLSLVFFSCTHKELFYEQNETSKVKVEFDWSEMPEANPAGMRVIFYPVSGGLPIIEDLVGKQGGWVDVPAGIYQAVCFNNDTESDLWKGLKTINTLEVYTRNTKVMEGVEGMAPIPLSDEASGQQIILPSDRLWKACIENLELKEDGAQKVTFHLLPLTKHLSFELTGVSNTQYLSMAKATLTNVSNGVFIGTNLLEKVPSMIPFDAKVDVSNRQIIEGEMEFFGVLPSENQKNIMTIFFWSPGGNIKVSFDVTTQIANAPNPYNIHLILQKKIEITEGVNNGKGFHTEVHNWEDESVNLDM